MHRSVRSWFTPLCFSAARAGLLGRPNVNAWRLRPDLICVRAPVLLTTGLHRQFATKAQAVNLKKGDLVIRKGKMCEVMKAQHVSQGQRPAYMQIELLDVNKGTRFMERFRVEEKVDVVEVENTKATYAGKSEDGALYQFTDAHSGEPIEVSAALLGEKAAYLEEDMVINIKTIDGKQIAVNYPQTAEVEVVDTTDYSSSGGQNLKPAKLSNGRTVRVPLFVQVGDRLEIRLEDESYVTRL